MTPEETSHHIAAQLAETGAAQRRQIAHIVGHLGEGRARALCQQAREIEAAGGMLTLDGKKRRTLGGIFFRLVYESAPDMARQLRQWQTMRKKRQAEASAVLQKAAAAGGALPIASDTKVTINQQATNPPVARSEDTKQVRIRTNEKGSIAIVKITLMGRPTKVIDKGEYIKLSMVSAETPPALPKGVPTPAPLATTYIVCIASRQWREVVEALKDEADSLIIEGWPQVNREKGNVAVFAMSCTTKKLQQQKRSAQLVGSTSEAPTDPYLSSAEAETEQEGTIPA